MRGAMTIGFVDFLRIQISKLYEVTCFLPLVCVVFRGLKITSSLVVSSGNI